MLRCSGVDGAREFGKQEPRRAKYLQNQPCFNKDNPPPARPRRIITVPESVLCLLFYIIVFGKARQRGNKVRGLSSVLQKRKTRPTRNSFVSFFGVVVHATLYTHPEPHSSTPLHPPPPPALIAIIVLARRRTYFLILAQRVVCLSSSKARARLSNNDCAPPRQKK